MRFLLTFLFLLSQNISFSQKTIVSGTAFNYIGEELIFYEFIERINNTKAEVFQITPNEKGFFSLEIELKETKFLFTEHGSCIYYFYAEPGRAYKLFFPVPLPKTPVQDANPFFIPSPVHLKVFAKDSISGKDCLELNEAILNYDNSFEAFYSKQILIYYSPIQNQEKLDSFKLASKISKPVCNSSFYEEYTEYKKGILEFTVKQFNLDQLIRDYFTDKPVLISNPAWWELFEKVYDKYFSVLASHQDFKNLYRFIAASDYTALDNLLKNELSLLNDTLRGLILIRELNNEFFEGSFSQTVLSSLLDSIAETSNSIHCRNLAKAVKIKNTRLLPGSVTPFFRVIDASGSEYSPEKFKGRYIYLGFSKPNSFNCMKEFEYLRYLEKKYNKYLTIITVYDNIPHGDLESIKEQNNYTWHLTRNLKRGDVYKDFDVRATPQFFLIAPDGNLLLSPAPLPSEGFERIMLSIMRNRGDI